MLKKRVVVLDSNEEEYLQTASYMIEVLQKFVDNIFQAEE